METNKSGLVGWVSSFSLDCFEQVVVFCVFQERVGNFLADFYAVNGLVLESRKRREHLSEEDILRNKAIMESLSKGGSISEQNFEVRPQT